MSYSYQIERPKIFTEEGSEQYIKVRDVVMQLLEDYGAFAWYAINRRVSGVDVWFMQACLDYMIEKKGIGLPSRT